VKNLKLFFIFAFMSFIPWAFIFKFAGLTIQAILFIIQLIGLSDLIFKCLTIKSSRLKRWGVLTAYY